MENLPFINNIGTMFEPTGYAKANRHIISEWIQHGVRVRYTPIHHEVVRVPLGNEQESLLNSLVYTPLPERHLSFFHYPAAYFTRRDSSYCIGMTMFECSRIPITWSKRCNMMDEIWVPSEFNRVTFIKSGVLPHKIRVMPYGVDTSMFTPGKAPLSIPGQRSYSFLSVCSFDGRKGIDTLVSAFLEEFTASEDVCLIIKTRASSEDEIAVQQKYIEQIASSIGVQDIAHVILLSSVQSWTEEELAALYNSANCYVLPTRGEGWSLTVMEAMATGLPVITTNWSAHLDFLNETNGYMISVQGFVHASSNNPRLLWAIPNKNHLKQLIRYVYTHPNEAAMKAQAGRQTITQRYSWKHSAANMLHRLLEISR
ncbi:glycosyltransferase family 4 protein [Paenibacillus guangzhouensis]|uniref:glycosyltransferase family 4 protein n=1 Tax=Paenibacillus guangzhouensis TaxID=1473112 RepID=UPI0012677522|nr:glycosyltransferase family 4 protein [Paenibacillus guangzhouensis]